MNKLILFFISLQVSAQDLSIIRIAATGDILVHNAQQLEAAAHPEKFYYLWKELTPYLKSADITVGNLEAPVAMGIDANGRDHGDIGFRYDLKVYSGTNMRFNFHPQILDDLKKTGFDVLSIANNHSMDRKSIGVDRTLDELNRKNWAFTGARYSNGEGPWGVTTTKGGRRIFWLGCAENTNGNPDPKGQILKCYEQKSEIKKMVIEAFRTHQAVILMPHWGDEYSDKPNAGQIKWAQEMADLNVTAILGNHPHVLQPVEMIKETLVSYSLGNFIAWQAGLKRKTSMILYFDLKLNAQNKLKVINVESLPIYRDGTRMYPQLSALKGEFKNYIEKNLKSNLPYSNNK